MNLAQNKFLVGFGAVVAVGVAGLGYHVISESSRLSAAETEYTSAATQYNTLRRSELYPDAANLEKLQAQKQEVFKAASALQDTLAPLSYPLEAISPQQFQDKLGTAVSTLVGNAQVAGVELPAKFYLGFEDYETTLASAEMAPLLYREMRVIESVISTLIEAKVVKIGPVSRAPIPGEKGSERARATPPAKGAQPAATAPTEPLITQYPFTIEFVSDQSQFRRVLNTMVTNDKQFLVVRDLKVKNSSPKPVAKGSSTPVQPALPLFDGEAGGAPLSPPPNAANLQYVLGTEKVEVTLSLDMIIVASRNSQ